MASYLANKQTNRFQSTHPVRGATRITVAEWLHGGISIHAPREGCDCRMIRPAPIRTISIHAPREGCDSLFCCIMELLVKISIHAPREGCDLHYSLQRWYQDISIHAPREGCDFRDMGSPVHRSISIHAPREGCDVRAAKHADGWHVFQSTHPVRGATIMCAIQFIVDGISIHAPREGCDVLLGAFAAPEEFQSTHPVRGATAGRRIRVRRHRYFNPRTP